jgi:hypothetical protein
MAIACAMPTRAVRSASAAAIAWMRLASPSAQDANLLGLRGRQRLDARRFLPRALVLRLTLIGLDVD